MPKERASGEKMTSQEVGAKWKQQGRVAGRQNRQRQRAEGMSLKEKTKAGL